MILKGVVCMYLDCRTDPSDVHSDSYKLGVKHGVKIDSLSKEQFEEMAV